MLTIRNERPEDYAAVEELTRRAFYNVYVPGCTEHYLVHIMRGHRDFLPELDFVAELDGRLIGNIMYTRSWLTDGDGNRREILTCGPVSILPECQRKGYGKQLMEHSFARARSAPSGRPAARVWEKACSPTKAPAATGSRPLPRRTSRSSMSPSSKSRLP